MNKNTILTIAGLGVIAYLLLRKKATPSKEIGQAPTASNATKRVVDGVDKGTIATTTATLKAQGVRIPRRKLIMVEDIKVPLKDPITISPVNLIPNVYDRGVGQPTMDVAATGNKYYNMSGICSENVQNACKCSEKSKVDYKLDIPSFL